MNESVIEYSNLESQSAAMCCLFEYMVSEKLNVLLSPSKNILDDMLNMPKYLSSLLKPG